MKYTAALLAFGAAAVSAQSCSENYETIFSFQTVNQTNTKRDLVERQSFSCDNAISLRLTNSVLLDNKGRTGYIASNDQFQFDAPPQADHKETSGFSVCDGKYLGLNGNTTFYNCLSGTFYNIYAQSQGAQCFPVYIDIFNCASQTGFPTAPINTVPSPDSTGVSSAMSSSAMMMTSSAAAMTTPAAMTPYPLGNSSMPAPTATGAVTSTPGSTTTTGSAVPGFTGAANVIAAGQKLVAVAAGVAAWAMF